MVVPIHVAFVEGPTPRWSDAVLSGIAETFPNPVGTIAAPVDLAATFVPARQQHHSSRVLAALLHHRPDATSKIIGIVPVDLFLPVLTFVFGEAQLDGPGALVSTCRLHAEFYGLPADEGLLVERVIKECVHELGHAFGLVHCQSYDCVMRSSTSVDEVDLKRSEFCAHCAQELEARGRK
ncbi:MAG: archaemetzincin family Zn-dependent metalloprotease [Gemmatimonadales bacterium]